MSNALDWQKEIYLKGLAGERSLIPTDFKRLEQVAHAAMSRKAFAYVAGGAGREQTIEDNLHSYNRCKIVPKVLRDVSVRDTSVNLLGHRYDTPFLLAPIGVLELVHRHADVAVARAAAKNRIPYIFSNQASFPMEACAQEMGDAPRWFQLYWSKSFKLVESFVMRAEHCGCQAIVVTLDTTMLGWRTRDIDLGYLPFLEGKGIAQYTADPVFTQMLYETEETVDIKRKINLQTISALISMVNRYPGNGFFSKLKSGLPVKAVRKFISTYSNPAVSWSDLPKLRSITKLPILLKGVLHPDDAKKASDIGMNGVIVSNHGGRQIDGCVPTFDALPEIAKAVNKNFAVIIDSGIRGGADAFKALALGATAVCIGRPYVYALAIAGESGVTALLKNYIADFELTMGLAGCKEIGDISIESINLNK